MEKKIGKNAKLLIASDLIYTLNKGADLLSFNKKRHT